MVYRAFAGQSLSEYDSTMPSAYAGLVTSTPLPGQYITAVNSGQYAKQTVGTLTVAGTIGTETFTITVNGESPVYGTFSRTVTVVATSGNTATNVAAALVTALNADEYINDVLVASNAAGVITLTVRYFGVNPITSVAGTASGSATLTASPTVTAFTDASALRFGYVAARYSGYGDNECSPMTTNSGVTILGITAAVNEYEQSYPIDFVDLSGVPALGVARIIKRVPIWVPVAAAVVRDTVPGVVNTTGQLTTAGVGTALTGAIYMTSAAAGGLALVSINIA